MSNMLHHEAVNELHICSVMERVTSNMQSFMEQLMSNTVQLTWRCSISSFSSVACSFQRKSSLQVASVWWPWMARATVKASTTAMMTYLVAMQSWGQFLYVQAITVQLVTKCNLLVHIYMNTYSTVHVVSCTRSHVPSSGINCYTVPVLYCAFFFPLW